MEPPEMAVFSFIDHPDVLNKYKKGDTSCQKKRRDCQKKQKS